MNINLIEKVLNIAELANDTVIMEGLHGIGKSSVVNNYCKNKGYLLKELFLSNMEAGDLLGMPRTKEVGTSLITTWAEPDWFQEITDAAWPQEFEFSNLHFKDENFKSYVQSINANITSRTLLNELYIAFYKLPKNKLYLVQNQDKVSCDLSRTSVLFLDELNRASLDVRQSSLQLILNKELHCHKLPFVNSKPTIIVAAINPADLYQVDEMDAALIDRMLHVEVKIDVKDWVKWAKENNVNRIIIDFVLEHKDVLHYMPEDGSTGSSPRSLEKLGKFIDHMEFMTDDIKFDIIKGKIGEELGYKFLVFLNNYNKTITLEDIEKLIKTKSEEVENVEELGLIVNEFIKELEPIQKTEMITRFVDKYIEKDVSESLPLLCYLYSLEIEILTAFLKNIKNENEKTYNTLVNFDSVINNKGLFKRIVLKYD